MVNRTATLHKSNPCDVAGSPLSKSETDIFPSPVMSHCQQVLAREIATFELEGTSLSILLPHLFIRSLSHSLVHLYEKHSKTYVGTFGLRLCWASWSTWGTIFGLTSSLWISSPNTPYASAQWCILSGFQSFSTLQSPQLKMAKSFFSFPLQVC